MNILIQNANLIIHKDDSTPEVIKGSICTIKDEIVAVGKVPADFVPDKIIEGEDKLVIPGLINAHNHAYMSVFRNMADDLPFGEWLFDNILPKEDKMKDEDAYWGAMLSIAEMLRSGTTCFSDMMIHKYQTTKAVADSGIRAVISRGLVGNGDDEAGRTRINQALDDINKYKDHPRLTFMIAPHAPYSTDAEFLKICAKTAKEQGVGIHIHLSEAQKEFDDIMSEHGVTPTKYVESTGLFEVPTLAAHCVRLTPEDMDILKKNNVSVVSNPVSNMKLGNGFAKIKELLSKGVNVCIGTDGPASNNTQNLIHEMSVMALIHKGVNNDAVSVSASDVFNMATINGAKALGLSDKIGSIKVGKKADLVIMDLKNPQFYPRQNLISALCYSANGSEVETVIVDGQIVMENKLLKNIDLELVYDNIEKISKR